VRHKEGKGVASSIRFQLHVPLANISFAAFSSQVVSEATQIARFGFIFCEFLTFVDITFTLMGVCDNQYLFSELGRFFHA
jgi:hypothetical protein